MILETTDEHDDPDGRVPRQPRPLRLRRFASSPTATRSRSCSTAVPPTDRRERRQRRRRPTSSVAAPTDAATRSITGCAPSAGPSCATVSWCEARSTPSPPAPDRSPAARPVRPGSFHAARSAVGFRVTEDSAMTLPLDGVRVVDLTRARAGPTAVRQLADMGADVVKVEAREEVEGTPPPSASTSSTCTATSARSRSTSSTRGRSRSSSAW